MGFFSKLETAAAAPFASEIQRASCEEETLVGGVATLPEREFRRVLCQERKRSERSRKDFVLMLVREKRRLPGATASVLPRITRILGRTIRDTDVLGWFTLNTEVGTIFCELGTGELGATVRCIEAKIFTALSAGLSPDELDIIELDFHSYPHSWNKSDDTHPPLSPVLFPDLLSASEQKRGALFVKRLIDVLGSALALVVLAPVFVLLALIIKLTSKGPVFFRQQRLGQFQQPFVFLKFRSMHVSTSHDIHREYVRNYIAGRAESAKKTDQRRVVYKITDDPRVTPIGRFMRRTSLDELPQFLNVLKGEMSLVGPRPPIPYEMEAYDIWHRRRLLEAKPGITGLWQVYGRSRTTFDEMVRLDLQYSRTFSLSSDIKILFETPRAVISGNGAY